MITISAADIQGDDARRLIAELDAYLNTLYPPEDNFLELPSEDVRDGRGVFLVAYLDGAPIGCGAVRRLTGARGELKRMYVCPSGRNRGVGAALLSSLEAWAREAGLTRLVLETGRAQAEAVRLYARAGFEPIEAYGPYASAPYSCCLGKDLPTPDLE